MAEPTKKCEKIVDKVEAPSRAFPRCAALCLETARKRITRTAVKGTRDAVVFDNVFTPGECHDLIAACERYGFTFWDSTPGATADFRSAYTIETTHVDLADEAWMRLRNHFPAKLVFDDEEDERFEIDLRGGAWVPDCINPKLLFARYRDGGHFGPHTDGSSVKSVNERTLYTLVVYLNDCDRGGETTLLSSSVRDGPYERDNATGRLQASREHIVHAVQPKAGRVLMFYHTEMHEGRAVAAGQEKYIIRSDVFYRREPPILTEPYDVEAFNLYQEALALSENGDPQAAALKFRSAFKTSGGLAELYKQ